MRIKAITGHQKIGTEVKDTTYVEAAGWGKYRWWRYVLGLMIILFAWMVAANVASALVALATLAVRRVSQPLVSWITRRLVPYGASS
ncbi:abortive infection protein [Nostoc sp. NIES-4103]|nr:abortive infection protein [Nostoc sp. NIES-4103]